MSDVSVLTPSFGYGDFIADSIRSVIGQDGLDVEHIVQDGASADETVPVLRSFEGRVEWVSEPDLGQSDALNRALARAGGRWVAWLNADEFYLPGGLNRLISEGERSGADVVYGVQSQRKGRLLERVSGHLFYTVVNRLLTDQIPRNVVTVRLMTRRYVRALVQHMDREICLAGLWVITGFDQRALEVVKGSRPGSSYSLRARASALVNAVTSFSNRPLIYIFYMGAIVVTISLIAASVLVVRALTGHIGVAGYASLIISIWFLGGLTLFSVGIVGVYLAKVFTETKNRPYTVIRAEYGTPEVDEHAGTPAADAAVLRR